LQVQTKKSNYKKVKTLFKNYIEIPNEWEFEKIGNLLDKKIILEIQDGNHGELHPKLNEFVSTGIPFVTANCIIDNQIDFKKCNFLTKERVKKLRIGFSKPNDVILTHKGSLGLCAIVPDTVKTLIMSPQTTYYRLSTKMNTKFLFYAFQSYLFQKQLFILGKQSTRDYVGITAQEELKIIIMPKPEQDKIATILSNIDSLIMQCKKIIGHTKKSNDVKKTINLERLKKGLMQKLLTGQIRVKV